MPQALHHASQAEDMMNPRLRGLQAATTQYVIAAGEALDAGRLDEADACLARCPEGDAGHPEVLRMKAGVHSLRGQHQEALSVMRRAMSACPSDALYHNTMASLLVGAGEYDAAITELRRACELQPNLALAWYNLGVTLVKCVRNEEAASALQ